MIPGMAGLIPAAGFSSRMGACKPLLRLGRKTIIERVIDLFRTQDITDILVVLGHGAPWLTDLVESSGARWIVNEDYREDMFSSVKIGVRHLCPDCRAFFLLPVDFPLVRSKTLVVLADAFLSSGMGICRPCYRNRKGHPPLISSALIKDMLDYEGREGMRSFLSGYEGSTIDVDCDDPGILLNLNHPEDYKIACDMLKEI